MASLLLLKYTSLGNTIGFVDKDFLDKEFVIYLCKNNALDQLMTLRSPVRIWNADGSEAMACGNGTRCLVAHIFSDILSHHDNKNIWSQRGFVFSHHDTRISFQGPVGTLEGFLSIDNNYNVQKLPLSLHQREIFVLQGPVDFHGGPMNFSEFLKKIKNSPLEIEYQNLHKNGQHILHSLGFYLTSIGNLHVIVPHENEKKDFFDVVAPFMERVAFFPQGANVSFLDTSCNFLKTWERGVGWTLGCGSALCCGAFVLHLLKKFLQQQGHNDPKDNSEDFSYTLETPGGKATVMRKNSFFIHGATVEKIFEKKISIP